MKLAEFVREALADIVFGIQTAKADTCDLAAIAPGRLNGDSLLEKSYVDFDIAVTVSSEQEGRTGSSGKVGAGINVVGFKVGGDGAISEDLLEKASRALTSRITFKVPVYFNAHFRGDIGSKDESHYVTSRWRHRYGPVVAEETER